MRLDWPRENAISPQLPLNQWFHASSNYCLDFHGDPACSEVNVFSDGNHHMALEQTLEVFRQSNGLDSIFYCTTPPKVYLDWWNAGCIELGNLRLSCLPDVVIGPVDILAGLHNSQKAREPIAFAESVGNSLLVAAGNPKAIHSIKDLFRSDVKTFMSNPTTEKASHVVYRETIENMAAQAGISSDTVAAFFSSEDSLVLGQLIHHREAPQAVANGDADVAIVYAHLALRYTRIFPDQFERVLLPTGKTNITTQYAVALVVDSRAPAAKLVEFFKGKTTADCYREHGLTPLLG